MSLQQLLQECQKVDSKLMKLEQTSKFPSTDNRKHFFGVLRYQITKYEMMLHILNTRYNQIIPEPVFIDVIGVGYTNQQHWEEFQVNIKMSCITMSHFMIENFFKTLLSVLDTSRDPLAGFYMIAKTLLDKITVTNKPQKLEILNGMALVRNSLHNNGIHAPIPPSPQSQTITFGTTILQFDKGKETKIFDSQMIGLIDAVVDIINEIVQSTEIQGLATVPIVFIPRF